jgi:phenylpyruvate tautomerase PptA (4-oxalocrotonate tautomerase family)
MPHLTVHVPETRVSAKEAELHSALTDAIVDVYGGWVRDIVNVIIDPIPAGRWTIGGHLADKAAYATFGLRASIFDRPDADQISARLGAAITTALAQTLGEDLRRGTTVELIAQRADRSFVGGEPAR